MKNIPMKIYQPRDVLLKMLFSLIGVIVVLLWIIYYEFDISNSINTILIYPITILEGMIILFGLFAILRLSKKIILKEPFLILNEDNIISQGIVPKSIIDIDDLQWYKNVPMLYQEFIIIKLRANSKSYDRIPFTTKKLFEYNSKKYGGEIGLSSNFLRESYSDVIIFLDEKNVFKID